MKAFYGLLIVTFVLRGGDSQSARELSNRAAQLYMEARYSEAEPLFRKALAAWTQLGPEAARDRAVDTRNLGAVLRVTGRFGEAEPVLLDAVQQLEASGAGSLDQTRAFDNLAALYRTTGDLKKAESFAERAVAVMNEKPEGAPAERVGPKLVLASVYIEEQQFDRGEALLRSSLDAADGAIAVVIYDDLATISNARGTYPQAEDYARQAIRFAKLALPADHPAAAASWTNLGQALRFQNKNADAEEAYQQAIAMWEKSLGPNHPELAKGLMNLAMFYHERGRETAAETLYRRAAAILEQAFGKNDPQALMARNELAEVFRGERRYTESAKLQRTTVSALEKSLPAGDPRLVRAQANYARLLQETGK